MAQVPDEAKKAHYIKDLEPVLQGDAPEWVKTIRSKAADRFRQTDLPHGKMEDWRFTNIAPVTGAEWRSRTEPSGAEVSVEQLQTYLYEGIDNVLVFVDGFYAKDLSNVTNLPDGIRVRNMAEAFANDGVALQPHLDVYASEVGNAYTALNSAFLTDGAFIHIGKNVVTDQPIHLVFLTTGSDDYVAVHPRVFVLAEQSSQAVLLETYVDLGTDAHYLNNAVGEYVLDPQANIHVYKLIEEGANGYHLAMQRVKQDRDSHYKSHVFNFGGQIARNEISLVLDGEGAGCSLHGLYLTEDGQLVDNHQSIDHAKPNCESWIGYKGVLADKSNGVFTGKILVRRDSQKTDSNQLNQNLLLSDKAQIDTKPQLEIYADDVKCTHGATIGQFPEELLTYFRTRGIARDMAVAMLTYGFADEVVEAVDVEPLRDRLGAFVFDKYSPSKHGRELR